MAKWRGIRKYKKEVNDLIWKVIWDNKPNQIERNVCCYWCIDCIKIQHINSYRYSSLRSCVLLNNLWITFLNHFMLDRDTNKHHNVSSAPRSGTDNTSYTMLYVRSNMSDLMMHIHTSFTDNTIYTMVYVRSLCLL
jgi:hypothetical protein